MRLFYSKSHFIVYQDRAEQRSSLWRLLTRRLLPARLRPTQRDALTLFLLRLPPKGLKLIRLLEFDFGSLPEVYKDVLIGENFNWNQMLRLVSECLTLSRLGLALDSGSSLLYNISRIASLFICVPTWNHDVFHNMLIIFEVDKCRHRKSWGWISPRVASVKITFECSERPGQFERFALEVVSNYRAGGRNWDFTTCSARE